MKKVKMILKLALGIVMCSMMGVYFGTKRASSTQAKWRTERSLKYAVKSNLTDRRSEFNFGKEILKLSELYLLSIAISEMSDEDFVLRFQSSWLEVKNEALAACVAERLARLGTENRLKVLESLENSSNKRILDAYAQLSAFQAMADISKLRQPFDLEQSRHKLTYVGRAFTLCDEADMQFAVKFAAASCVPRRELALSALLRRFLDVKHPTIWYETACLLSDEEIANNEDILFPGMGALTDAQLQEALQTPLRKLAIVHLSSRSPIEGLLIAQERNTATDMSAWLAGVERIAVPDSVKQLMTYLNDSRHTMPAPFVRTALQRLAIGAAEHNWRDSYSILMDLPDSKPKSQVEEIVAAKIVSTSSDSALLDILEHTEGPLRVKVWSILSEDETRRSGLSKRMPQEIIEALQAPSLHDDPFAQK
jgi:hypothetical protein